MAIKRICYVITKWHLDPSSHLATTDMGRKFGGCAPLGDWELGPHLTQCGQERGPPVCHVDPSSRLATIDIGLKLEGFAPFWGGGAGSPSSTKSIGPRPTSIPSGILIHVAIFGHNKHGKKIGGSAPFLGRGAGSPSTYIY